MPEILSQSQIDELLSSMFSDDTETEQAGGGEIGKKVKEYDFRSPQKLSKEQFKALLGVYENIARHLASYFSGILRTYCEISVQTIEEHPYYEYNNSLPDSVLIGVLDAKPIEGPVLVDISNQVTFSLIERLLGGNGEAAVPEREFTEIEVVLMERIFKQMASFMQEVWSHFLNMTVSLKQMETNARLIRSIAMDEVVALIIMDINIKSVKGTINICVPCINLESILDQLNYNLVTSKHRMDSNQKSLLEGSILAKIKSSSIEIKGIFGETNLTLNEVMNLQVGDVIKLDQSVDDQVRVLVDEKPWFSGVPGIRRNKKAIKICRAL